MTAFVQHALMCSLKFNCLSMVIPSTFTQSCEIIQVLLSKTNAVGANEEDDKIIN